MHSATLTTGSALGGKGGGRRYLVDVHSGASHDQVGHQAQSFQGEGQAAASVVALHQLADGVRLLPHRYLPGSALLVLHQLNNQGKE